MANVWIDYGANTIPPSVMDRIPSSLHAGIFAGTSTVDVSSYINSALAEWKMVRLPIVGRLCVGSPLVVPSGGAILGLNYQCTIKALPNFGNNPVVTNATVAPASEAVRDRHITLTGFRIDGSLDVNSTATEFGHGVKLQAVDGCDVDLDVFDVKGDGLAILASESYLHVGCSKIAGRMRTTRCHRQGVSLICGEQISLEIFDTETRLMSLCIEPDRPEQEIKNCNFRVHSLRTGVGSDVSGGFACVGDGAGGQPTNIIIDFNVHEAGGYGGVWRDALNLTLRGSIFACARGGLVGLDGGATRSTVYFDGVRVMNPGLAGFTAREYPGSVYDGSIFIEGAGGAGAKIENAHDGVLQLRIQNSRQEGLYLRNCVNMVFPNLISNGNNGNNVWLASGSHSNRFPGLRANSSNFGWGFIEESGASNNKARDARVEGNARGNVLLAGQSSYVLPEI